MTKTAPATPQRIVGFCWFHRASYDSARAAMADPEVLFDTFDEWLSAAKKIEADVTAKGDKVLRIRFDLASFLLFCVGKGTLPNEQARASWAAAEARKKFTGR
jgi:hypothetical protein